MFYCINIFSNKKKVGLNENTIELNLPDNKNKEKDTDIDEKNTNSKEDIEQLNCINKYYSYIVWIIIFLIIYTLPLLPVIFVNTIYKLPDVKDLKLYINDSINCDAICYFCNNCDENYENIFTINLNKGKDLYSIEWEKLLYCDKKYNLINNCSIIYKSLEDNINSVITYDYDVLYGDNGYKFLKTTYYYYYSGNITHEYPNNYPAELEWNESLILLTISFYIITVLFSIWGIFWILIGTNRVDDTNQNQKPIRL